jgi:hypothetical protein
LVGGNTTVIEPGGCAWPTGYRLGRVYVLLQPRGLEQVDGVTVPAGWHAAEPPPGLGCAALIGALSSDGVLARFPPRSQPVPLSLASGEFAATTDAISGIESFSTIPLFYMRPEGRFTRGTKIEFDRA